MKQLKHIGTIEHISLPNDGVSDVPAKIDTGADNSAIWASNIHIVDGALHFNFFAPGSVFYREEPVVSTAYRTTSVRNSFGHKEFRYKIKLKITIGRQSLTRWFTLADRSRNNYPILLGKNFLKNTFIVDVSKKHLVSTGNGLHRILIFAEPTDQTVGFFEQVQEQHTTPVQYECVSYNQLYFHIDGAATKVINLASGDDISQYSFTYFKNHKQRELSASAAQYLHYKAQPFADQEFLQYMSASKLSEYMRLSTHGITVPPTITTSTSLLLGKYHEIVEALGSPFVLKEIKSDKGKFNYLIHSEADFKTQLSDVPSDHIYCAQKYIPNDGYYRLNIMGKQVGLAIWRSSTPHKDRLKEHLNKPKGSANATNIPIADVPGEAQDLALRAATCMNRQVCGVDILQDKTTGLWYILEANNDPQIRSGSFVPEKAVMVAKYFEKELNQ